MFGKLHRARKTGDWTMIFHFKFEPNHARYAKLSRQQSIIGQLCNLLPSVMIGKNDQASEESDNFVERLRECCQ